MRIEIRRQTASGMQPVVIITFHTHPERFDSEYEKTKFFRELHGWRQTVPRNGKRYVYQRAGLLDEVPCAKVADSVFITALEHMKRMEAFFKAWEDKVEWDMREALMARRDVEEMLRRL